MTVGNYNTHCILIDNGSSVDILFMQAFEKMKLDRSKIIPVTTPLVGFTGERILPIGTITLPVIVGTFPKERNLLVNFFIVDQPSAYNSIIGKPTLNQLQVATSTYHLIMKFPIENGVKIIRGNQKEACQCYNISLKDQKEALPVGFEIRDERTLQQAKPAEDLIKVSIEGSERKVKIGS